MHKVMDAVDLSRLTKNQDMPTVVTPAGSALDACRWASSNRPWVNEKLTTSGALLFRDFGIQSAEGFNEFVQAVSGEPLEYRERSSPRSQVMGNIYTSTDYPPRYSIFLHNENSYSSSWPLKLFFYCDLPAASGGETPIAPNRKIMERISKPVRQRFIDRGVMYVRNFGQGLGLAWATVFQTTDRAQVGRYCSKIGMEAEWRGDQLRTRHVRPAVAKHPVTGEEVWFNHATFFHISTLEPMIRDALLDSFPEEDLPNNTYYGDGSRIEDAALDELRAAYEAEKLIFPWQKGDVLLVDNMLVCHGRSPYKGARRTLVAMVEPFQA